VFAYERRAGASTARVALNFGAEPRALDLGGGAVQAARSTRPSRPRLATGGRVELAPCEGVVVVLG
jgi:hypothetical protein